MIVTLEALMTVREPLTIKEVRKLCEARFQSWRDRSLPDDDLPNVPECPFTNALTHRLIDNV